MKGIVIAGFSGIGKTTLANKYKNVIDLDAREFAYDDSDIMHIPLEKRKGEKRPANPNWPQNYIDAIKKVINKYDIILVWDREDIIKEYLKNKIEFILCYPAKEDLKYYIQRFKERGNTPQYIEWKLKQYEEKLLFFQTLTVKKIILVKNETLEDYLKNNKIKLVSKMK